MKKMYIALLVAVVTLTGCGLIPEAAKPTKTMAPLPTQTAVLGFDEEAEAEVTVTPQKETAAPKSTVEAAAAVAEYDLDVLVDYEKRLVQVHQTIRGVNSTEETLTELPLVIEANLLQGVFVPGAMRVGKGEPQQNYVVDGRVLRVQMEAPLAPGAGYSLELTYSLNIPLTFGWLSYTGKQLNLGDWYPFIPAYQPGKGFLIHNPGSSGEYLVYPRIDYRVNLTLAEHPSPLVVAASAPVEKVDGATYSYSFRGGRTFAFSISPDFQVKQDGVVDIYYYAEHAVPAEASLRVVNDALALYADLFAPYPYPRLAVVEGDFFDGMEYTGLFFLGSEYFETYPSNPESYLTALSAHETAHQWWYGVVGNDSALEPWLDEAFSTYSELLYYEKYHPDLVKWWWSYRVFRFDPVGAVNSTIYEFDGFRPYVNAVYLNGARFLQEIRENIGTEVFMKVLAHIAAHQQELLTGDVVLELMRERGGDDLEKIIGKYFQ